MPPLSPIKPCLSQLLLRALLYRFRESEANRPLSFSHSFGWGIHWGSSVESWSPLPLFNCVKSCGFVRLELFPARNERLTIVLGKSLEVAEKKAELTLTRE